MSARARHLLLTILAGLLVVLYIGLLHHFTAQGRPSVIGGALALLPMGITTAWLAWISSHRTLAVGAWIAIAALLAVNHEVLAQQFAYIELLQHAGTFACLSAVFGRTLAPDRTPMVSVFARTAHGSLPDALARYTRKVTIAWTTLFVLMATTSLALFFSGHIAQWSLLANVLTPIIIATMFLVEYLVRRKALPPEMRSGLVASVRASWPAFDRWADTRSRLSDDPPDRKAQAKPVD